MRVPSLCNAGFSSCVQYPWALPHPILNLIIELLEFLWALWKEVWGWAGILLLAILLLYLRSPEKFERIAIHVSWLLSRVSRKYEKVAVQREVRHMIASKFRKNFEITEIPEIVIEWGDEEKVLQDVRRGRLVIVLRGREDRYENVARALIAVIPDLLAPEMKAVYDRDFLNCLSAHVARTLASEQPSIVTAINKAISASIEENPRLKELSSMLVEIDDRSLLSRVLVPELVRVAKRRYPQRDPEIDEEVAEFIKLLYRLSRGEGVEEPVIYGKYIRVAFVLVAKPEKIEALFEPHIRFVKGILSRHRGLESLYVLAAGRNVAAGRACAMRLEMELRSWGRVVSRKDYVYEGRYRDVPRTKLYVGRIRFL